MNFIDKAVGFFSPERGLKRARARNAMRIYDGAQQGRRASAWRGRGTSANAEIAVAIGPLRDRARDLVRNTPHATRLLDVMVGHIVGDGIWPVANTGSDRMNDKVDALWERWQAEADVEGIDSFYAMQATAVRSMIQDGEVVLRYVDEKAPDTELPLQLQLLEGDFIDHSKEGPYRANGSGGNTRYSRLGVGLGTNDRRTGLWLFDQHPGEMSYARANNINSVFVPADEVAHLFRRHRPGQVRGISWFAPMLTTARDFADFMDAITVKARVEACFAAFVTETDEFEDILPSSTTVSATADSDSTVVGELEPGTINKLRPGQDVRFAQPSTNSQVESVMMFSLMAMGSALGVTYDQISGDLRQANYSSLRAGKLDFQTVVKAVQKLVVIPRLCDRTWKRFISRAIISGDLKDRAGGYPCDWMTPAFESVNPKFDQDAEERSVRAGRMTPQEYFASWGANWRKQLRDFAEFYDYADKLKVALDIDVRNYSRAGLKQQTKGAPGSAAGSQTGDSTGAGTGAGGSSGGGDEGRGPQEVVLVDSNGEPIDLSDLQDALGVHGEGGPDVGPFRTTH